MAVSFPDSVQDGVGRLCFLKGAVLFNTTISTCQDLLAFHLSKFSQHSFVPTPLYRRLPGLGFQDASNRRVWIFYWRRKPMVSGICVVIHRWLCPKTPGVHWSDCRCHGGHWCVNSRWERYELATLHLGGHSYNVKSWLKNTVSINPSIWIHIDRNSTRRAVSLLILVENQSQTELYKASHESKSSGENQIVHPIFLSTVDSRQMVSVSKLWKQRKRNILGLVIFLRNGVITSSPTGNTVHRQITCNLRVTLCSYVLRTSPQTGTRWHRTHLLHFSKRDWLSLIASVHSPLSHVYSVSGRNSFWDWLGQFVKQGQLLC